MYQIVLITSILMMISIILMSLNFLLSKKSWQDREKSSPFECGFDPISHNHLPFSIHFFIISLIFLVFDIEIALLLPLIFLLYAFNYYVLIMSLLFLMILIYGLYLEYSEQSIDWKI